jgi:two-component system OmpR family sensor kinase
MMDLSPIRRRLAAWNLVVLALVLAVTVTSAAVGERRAAERAIDEALRAAAARAALRLELARHHEHRERRRHAEPDADDDVRAQESLVVIALRAGEADATVNRARMPDGLPDGGALEGALLGRSSFSERVSAGEPLRLHTVPVLHEGRMLGAVQVALPVGESRRALYRSVLVLLFTGAAGLVLAAAGSAFLAGRAVRPIGEALERQRRFIADASHELRTPVAVLRARAELLAQEDLPEEARDEVARLHQDADELADLLEELLDLARLDAAGEPLALAPVAMDEVAEEVVAQLRPLAGERGVTLTARAEPLWARAHLGRVRQVLRALADNALKHTPAGGTVTVEIARADGRVVVSVRDDGEGIAAEHLPHLFDRFYRVDAARARGGAGLGLAIAAELVRRMEGEIRVESTPGKGTVAKVHLLPAR